MTKRISSLLLAFAAFVALFAAAPAHATHLRGTSLTWAPTQNGAPGQVTFTINFSDRTDYSGQCGSGSCVLGSQISIPINFGDNSSGNIIATVTSLDVADDYLTATGTINHTYAGAGPYTAYYEACCRINSLVSGRDDDLRMETLVSPRATPAVYAPVVTEPAIITVPLQGTTGFFINASSFTGSTLSYRLSTAEEMYALTVFSCAADQPPGLSVNPTSGQVTWNIAAIQAAGCGFAAPEAGDLWAVQFMVQSLDSMGNVVAKTPLDVIVTFSNSTEAPPSLVFSNPGPITTIAGRPVTFTATGDDTATGSRVVLNNSGLPTGASATNLNAELAPPIVSAFSWTPTLAQVGTNYVIGYTVTNDTLEQVQGSVTINVVQPQPPVLSCPVSLSTQYLVPLTVPITVTDPQSDAVTVVFSVDGTSVQTFNVPATGATTPLFINQLFGSAGLHSVVVSASNTDSLSSICTIPVTVTPAPQVITFAPLGSPVTVNGTATLAATTSSGAPVTYTVTSGAATISGTTITYTNAGAVTIAADSAATTNYQAAQTVSQTITVNPEPSAYIAPTEPVGTSSTTQTAYVNFTAAGTLGAVSVVTQGNPNLDFQYVTGGTCAVGVTYTAGQACSVEYVFTPTSAGSRIGATLVKDASGNVLGTSYLSGIGTGPLALFTTATQTLSFSGLNQPRGLSTDGFGNLYVMDTVSGNVYEYAAGTGTRSTIASGYYANFGGATAVDGAGNVYFSSLNSGYIYEIVNGSPVPIANLATDDELLADGAGNLYASGPEDGSLWKIAAGTHQLINLLPSGSLSRIIGFGSDLAGDLFPADYYSNTLYELPAGSSTLIPLVSNDGYLDHPHGVALDPAGNIYVTNNSGNNNVLRYAAGTYALTVLPALGTQGITIDGSGNLITVLDGSDVVEYSRTAAPSLSFPDTLVGSSSTGGSVTLENDGNAPLLITSYAATTGFSVSGPSNTCAVGTLAAGGTCQIGATFVPTTPGPQTGAATLTDNSKNVAGAQQSIPLSGNGLQQTPGIGVASANIPYGTSTVGVSATISFSGTIAPTGTVTFSIDSGAPVVASCSGTTSPLTCTATYPSSTLGVPTHTITATIAPTPGFLANSGTNTLTVTPVALTVAIIGSPTKVYDGTTAAALTSANYQVNGVVSPDIITVTQPSGTYASANAGPESVTASLTTSNFSATNGSLNNYTLPPGATGSGHITQAPSVTTVTCPASVTYNGTAQTPCTATVTGANLNQSVTVTYSSNLHAGTATATATYNGDTDHTGSTKSVNFTITKINPVITWANPAAITYGTPLSATQLDATANIPGTFFYTAPVVGLNPAGTLLPAGVSPLGAGFTPTDTTDYNSISAYVQITVNKATTTTTIAVTTAQTVTGTTATITATVHPQIGGTPTGTVTYYNGSTVLGSAAVGTPFTTPVLPVGTDQLSAVYSGDTNFITSTSAKTSVTSIAPTNVTLSPALSHVFYPASAVSFTVIVPLKNLQLISGTITLYDGSTVIGTYSLPAGGVLVGITPQLSVGTHNLRAVYSGNAQYPPGESPVQTVTVSAL